MRSLNFPASLIAGMLCVTIFAAPAIAGETAVLDRPGGEVILTISGAIERRNADDSATFDLAMLEKLGVTTIRTSTPWTDGTQAFTGVLMRDILRAVGAHGDTVNAIARNNYSYRIPVSDFLEFPVLLAFAVNDVPLQLRDKGPLWIVYPRDEFPELATQMIERRMVWQLRALVIE